MSYKDLDLPPESYWGDETEPEPLDHDALLRGFVANMVDVSNLKLADYIQEAMETKGGLKGMVTNDIFFYLVDEKKICLDDYPNIVLLLYKKFQRESQGIINLIEEKLK